jgi:signal transduction histidine kinase
MPLKEMGALDCLISNAIDCMPNGGNLCLTVTTGAKGLNIEISDTGTGMPPEVQQKILQSSSSVIAGTVGLYIGTSFRFRRSTFRPGSMRLKF